MGDDSTTSPVVRFERPTSQDLNPFSTGHTSGPGKPLKWFGILMTLNPNLNVGENEMKDF